MQKSIFGLFFIITAICSYGQGESSPREEYLFEQGSLGQRLVWDMGLDQTIHSPDSSKEAKEIATQMKERMLTAALESCQHLIDSFPKSKLLYDALNNMGTIEFSLGHQANAKKTFLKILNSNADDKEPDEFSSGSLSKRYPNYKNRAVKMLAEISMADSNYKEALMYLDKTKQYEYRSFCGNGYAEEAIYVAELYARCYIGLKDDRKALDILIPHIIENALTDNSALVFLTYNTLLKTYKKEDLRKLYEEAFKNYKVKKVKSDREDYNLYSINFLNTKIELDPFLLELAAKQPNDIRDNIDRMYRRSLLYHLLSQ